MPGSCTNGTSVSFAEYGLGAKERQLYQLHTPDLGLLFHEVLERFSRACRIQQVHAVNFSAEYQAAAVGKLNYDRRQGVMQTEADFRTGRDKSPVLQMAHECPGGTGGNALQPPNQIAVCRRIQK